MSVPTTKEPEKKKPRLRRGRTNASASSTRPRRQRLMSKRDVLALTQVTWPTIVTWINQKRFPPARILGNSEAYSSKLAWLGSEIDAWLDGLPLRHERRSGSKNRLTASRTGRAA